MVLTVAEVEALARVGVSEDVLNEGGTMQVNDEMVERFKKAWNEADVEGDVGNRVRRGLSAALSVVDEAELAEVERAAAEKAWHEGFCRGEVSGGREWPINPHAENPYRRGGSDD